jgi:hypothetical protein
MSQDNFKAFPYTGAGSDGMDLRDYFAAKAISTMNWVNPQISAEECYRIADALIKARENHE